MHLGLVFAVFATKGHIFMSFRVGFLVWELSEAEIADFVKRRERRVSNNGFGGVNEFTRADSPSRENCSAYGVGEAYSDWRRRRAIRLCLGGGGGKGSKDRWRFFELGGPTTITKQR